MIKKIQSSEHSINSILGENTSLKGIFNINGPLRIDGNFQGQIHSTGKVIIGKAGRAECEITAKKVVIGGTVKGDVIADENVIVLKTGEIIGNIYACSVRMENGVIFNGKCNILPKEKIKEMIKNTQNKKFLFN